MKEVWLKAYEQLRQELDREPTDEEVHNLFIHMIASVEDLIDM